MEDAPSGDLDEQHDPWDAERIRAAARVVLDRGGVLLTVAVLAEADGAVAGYTELMLPTPASTKSGSEAGARRARLPAGRRRALRTVNG
ncbi:hypothetical protein QT196_25445 [Streptomyces sp. P9-2B-2]|uniref:hypothetical protein n=1 Tax=Streptomyces sp. P9-2B-2 TaxID=3057114 RepID=UPI0025B4C023|nr:hypothetical protein [Streptomyces sp. P9-2B-2]WJY40350.1 hypothetical protein QT196_25445 [Streptomyces sp. P9-2B-2]